MGLSVSDYSIDGISNKIYSKYSNQAIDTDADASSSGYLDFDGYLTLLTAQMSNQDFNNSMSDSEFIQQMASYSMMEAISNMTQQNELSYASSLIGKAVTVSDSSGGIDSGYVEAVTMSGSNAYLLVNGNQYSVDKVTDIVDSSVYSALSSFKGHTVEVNSGNADGSYVYGQVESVYISSGTGYVVLDNGGIYDLSLINRIVTSTDSEDTDNSDDGGSDTDDTDSTVDSDDTDSTVESADNENISEQTAEDISSDDYEAATASVSEAAAASYVADNRTSDAVTFSTSASAESLDILMKILDGEETDTSALSELSKAAVSSRLSGLVSGTAYVEDAAAKMGLYSDNITIPQPYVSGSSLQQTSYTDYADSYTDIPEESSDIEEVPIDYEELFADDSSANVYDANGNVLSTNLLSARSGLYSDTSRLPAPYISGSALNSSTGDSTVSTVSSNVSNAAVTVQSSVSESSSYDRGGEYGVTTVSSSDAQTQELSSYAADTSYYNIPSSTRKYADEYPMEAAFADTTGTHMADIRFIGNTDIMNKVDTSQVICYSEKGRPVCDIGWCGQGRLGEVVTFADGRQRVEVILGDNVSYLYTSGNYTLNEMFSNNQTPGYFNGKLTPQEIAIIHYAQEYTPAEEAEMKQFGDYAAANARAVFG